MLSTILKSSLYHLILLVSTGIGKLLVYKMNVHNDLFRSGVIVVPTTGEEEGNSSGSRVGESHSYVCLERFGFSPNIS